MGTVKYSDIMRDASLLVSDYLLDGYYIYFDNAIYSDTPFVVFLTKNGKEGVAVSVRTDYFSADGRRLSLVVSSFPYFRDRFGFASSSWRDDSNTISEVRYFEIARRRWYVSSKEEYDAAMSIRRARSCGGNRAAFESKPMTLTARFLNGRVRAHRGFKTAKPCDVGIRRTSRGYLVYKRGGGKPGLYDYEVRFPKPSRP